MSFFGKPACDHIGHEWVPVFGPMKYPPNTDAAHKICDKCGKISPRTDADAKLPRKPGSYIILEGMLNDQEKAK